jgi:two-component system, NarL family, response regulator
MTDNNRIHLLIAEDHPVLLQAFTVYFSVQKNVEVVGQAADTRQALSLSDQLQPEVILVSSTLRPMNILKFIGRLCEQNPDTRIVVLSSDIDHLDKQKYLEAGASQAVIKGILATDLLGVIHKAFTES